MNYELDNLINSFIAGLNNELATVNECITRFEEARKKAEANGRWRTASIHDGYLTQANNDRKKIVRILTALDCNQG